MLDASGEEPAGIPVFDPTRNGPTSRVANPFLTPYLDILRVPGALRFSAAGWFGRIVRSTAGIGAILLVAAHADNYALAGAVSGSVVLGAAIASPAWSRIVDARGQTAVLPFAIASAALAAAGLVLAVQLDGPAWTWFLAAFLVGASSIDAGSLARARWIHLLPTARERHTALALESVGDEFTFVIGPPLVTLLAGLVSPAFGFLTGVAMSLLGLLALLAQRSTAPRPAGAPTARRAWLPSGVLGLLPGYVGVGLVFGSVDLTAVGVGREAGNPAIAGLLLAVFAVGSVTSGFVFGTLSARWPTLRRVVVAGLAFAIVTPLFLFVRGVPLLAAVSLTAGLVTTPVLIAGASLIESIVDRSIVTTAMAWPTVALSLGVTVGASLAGSAIDANGAWAGLVVPAVAGAIVGTTGVLNGLLRSRLPGAELSR